jgi:glyoxylase-like metal-dependent hydrolase (beta-lactamase superfamily II)
MKFLLLVFFVTALCAAPRWSLDGEYSVSHIADGVYVFSSSFYASLFVVTKEGVIATDPISPTVAPLYKQAIRHLTDKPVRYVIYSHDHTDHIAGGAVFKDTARFIAHENARKRIVARANPDIVVPQVSFRDKYELRLGGVNVRLEYLGTNHTDGNVAILLPEQKVLMFVDMVYPGSVPFRDMPGTDLGGFLASLQKLKDLDFKIILYGHGVPGGREWVDRYIEYFGDMRMSVERNERAMGFSEAISRQSADPRKLLDLYIDRIADKTVEELRRKYGSWGGFDDWAGMNVRRMMFYLMMET